jgi:hypothetical protein
VAAFLFQIFIMASLAGPGVFPGSAFVRVSQISARSASVAANDFRAGGAKEQHRVGSKMPRGDRLSLCG